MPPADTAPIPLFNQSFDLSQREEAPEEPDTTVADAPEVPEPADKGDDTEQPDDGLVEFELQDGRKTRGTPEARDNYKAIMLERSRFQSERDRLARELEMERRLKSVEGRQAAPQAPQRPEAPAFDSKAFLKRAAGVDAQFGAEGAVAGLFEEMLGIQDAQKAYIRSLEGKLEEHEELMGTLHHEYRQIVPTTREAQESGLIRNYLANSNLPVKVEPERVQAFLGQIRQDALARGEAESYVYSERGRDHLFQVALNSAIVEALQASPAPETDEPAPPNGATPRPRPNLPRTAGRAATTPRSNSRIVVQPVEDEAKLIRQTLAHFSGAK